MPWFMSTLDMTNINIQICKYTYGYKKICQHWKILRCISINKYYKYFVIRNNCRGNHASICLRWLKLNQFLTLSSLPITIKQVLWWKHFSDVKLRYVSLLDCYSLMAILECWPWLALVVVFITYNWRSLLYLLPIITVKAFGAPPFFGDIQTDK